MTTINAWYRAVAAGFLFAVTAALFCTPVLAQATTVTSFTPTQGVAGTAVEITGQDFFIPSSVKFNGVNASFSVQGRTLITAYVPSTATTGPISVTDPLYGTGTSTTNFTIPAPIITSFAPVKVVPITWIIIKGTFLTGTSAVTFNGVPAWSWFFYDDSVVWAQVPPTATSGPITVTTPGGSTTSSTSYIRIPGLLANPTFDTDTAGWFATIASTGAWDPLDADGAAGSGSGLFTHAANHYGVAGFEQCTSVSPNLQYRAGGRYLIPAGQPLGSNNEFILGPIWYSGTECNVGTFITSNVYDRQVDALPMGRWQTATVAAMSPPNAQSARVQVAMLTNNLLRAHVDNMFFDVDAPPSIATVVPPMGVRGTEVSIQGSGFYGVTSVQFDTTPASFTIRSANEIRAFVPATAVDGPIHVSAPAGVADSASFDVILPPVITIRPNAAREGSPIGIFGNDLFSATSVTFNGVPVSFSVLHGSLFVTVPPGATTGPVTVTNPGGNGSASFTLIVTRGDLNGDAMSDIIWRNPGSGDDSFWLMNGPVVGSSASLPTVDPAFQIAGIGDFQGDGRTDILWHNPATGTNVIWLMSLPLAFVPGVLPTMADTNWTVAGLGDFQGDGKADILWRNTVTGDNEVWLMDGLSVAVRAALLPVPDTNWKVAAIGDFQFDGKADIVWRNALSGDNSIWLMDGLTAAVRAPLPPVPDTNWKIAGAGDLQGDGKADLVWRNSATGDNSVWFMNGLSKVGASLPPVPDTAWTIARIADFQGDGKADIMWRNPLTGSNSQWLMNGPAVAVPSSLPSVPTSFQVAGRP